MDRRTKVGTTCEGLPCTVTLHYVDEAPDGASPERITGVYQAVDGPGAFEIVRDGEQFRDSDSGATHRFAHALLPWVVAEGSW